ncbi:MAG TPA: AraC family transcriptional regulator [Candidatus Kapabacteria bacterium]
MKLYIKYMVSTRCKLMVKDELERLGIIDADVDIGEVKLKKDMPKAQKKEFNTALKKIGLLLIEDKRSILVEKIKHVVIKAIHYTDKALKVKFSDHLSRTLQYSYTYLSNIFSKTTGSTIEKLVIKHKIEKVKELIIYYELTLTEIAYRLSYSSVAHLSNQFKKVTGLTPTSFKRLEDKRRYGIENV